MKLDIPRLSWVNAKTRSLAVPRKNASGHREEQVEANAENASRLFTEQIEKALIQNQEGV